MSINNNYESVVSYVEGDMDQKTKFQFEKDLVRDPELKAEYDAYLAAKNAADLLGLDILEEAQKKTQSKLTVASKKNSGTRYYTYAIAASLLFLIGFGMQFLFQADKDYSQIAMNYSEKAIINATRGDAPNNSVDIGLYQYSIKEYKHALGFFEKLKAKRKTDPYLTYIMAFSHHHLSQHDVAQKFWTELISFDKNNYTETAEWQLAITLLLKGDTEKALTQLKLISEKSDHSFQAKAVKLINELENA